MKKIFLVVLAVLAPLWLAGCGSGERKPSTRFQMPEGSAARGLEAFVALQCVACHRVSGIDLLPAPTVEASQVVTLGGEVTRLRSYGDLITLIIHPSRTLSELMPATIPVDAARQSPMPSVNDRMTVEQLIDLVTFLHPRYQQLEPIYQTDAPYYYYGP